MQPSDLKWIADVVTAKLEVRLVAANLHQEANEASAKGMDGAGAGVRNDE